MADRFPSQVSLRGVSRAYGRTFALHRVNLDLRAGSITAVLGDNGAGKSTLLNLLATVDQPTAGEIRYDDFSFRQFAGKARHRIGWVSHQSLLYDELTARENLLFFCGMYGLDKGGARADSWLRRVGLSEAADRRVQAFSRGMKQRLTVARALLHNPQLLLLDEPATGLDQQGSELICALLEELRQRQRIVVIVTHDFDLIDGLADQIVIMRRSKVALDCPRSDVTDLVETYRAHASRLDPGKQASPPHLNL